MNTRVKPAPALRRSALLLVPLPAAPLQVKRSMNFAREQVEEVETQWKAVYDSAGIPGTCPTARTHRTHTLHAIRHAIVHVGLRGVL